MAKLKKTARTKTAANKHNASELQAKAEQMSRSLVESAQQIWMAGVGAFNRAQGEGSKMFEALVKEGMSIEQQTRKLTTGRVDAVRDAVEDRVGVVRERASDTWDRLEKVFEERVQRALHRLGVPGREDLVGLSQRVDSLTAQLRQGKGKAAPEKAVKATKATKKVAKPAKATKKAANGARKPAARKAAAKRLPKAPRPVTPRA